MEGKTCTGDCLKCGMQQQMYCAAQRTYAIMRNQEAIVERLDRLDQALSLLAPPSGGMINPLDDGAQKGAGAENRAPENHIIQ